MDNEIEMELLEIEHELAIHLAYEATVDWATELLKSKSVEGSPWPREYIETELRRHHRRWVMLKRAR